MKCKRCSRKARKGRPHCDLHLAKLEEYRNRHERKSRLEAAGERPFNLEAWREVMRNLAEALRAA